MKRKERKLKKIEEEPEDDEDMDDLEGDEDNAEEAEDQDDQDDEDDEAPESLKDKAKDKTLSEKLERSESLIVEQKERYLRLLDHVIDIKTKIDVLKNWSDNAVVAINSLTDRVRLIEDNFNEMLQREEQSPKAQQDQYDNFTPEEGEIPQPSNRGVVGL